jgi:hypothetical protein
MTPNHTQYISPNGAATLSKTRDRVWDDAPERDDTSRPPPPAQQAWSDAVAFVTLRAKDYYGAELHGRLDKAQTLVLGGQVTLGDGVATIISQTDSATRYTVNGGCECPDAEGKATDGRKQPPCWSGAAPTVRLTSRRHCRPRRQSA